MTLIVSMATPSYVVAVADRLLSWPNGKRAEDGANKIVMFCNHMAFAYTGAAILEGKKTDTWIADELYTLPDRSILGACERLRDRATSVFRKESWLKGVFHTFLGIGFTQVDDNPSLCPIFMEVTNAYSDSRAHAL